MMPGTNSSLSAYLLQDGPDVEQGVAKQRQYERTCTMVHHKKQQGSIYALLIRWESKLLNQFGNADSCVPFSEYATKLKENTNQVAETLEVVLKDTRTNEQFDAELSLEPTVVNRAQSALQATTDNAGVAVGAPLLLGSEVGLDTRSDKQQRSPEVAKVPYSILLTASERFQDPITIKEGMLQPIYEVPMRVFWVVASVFLSIVFFFFVRCFYGLDARFHLSTWCFMLIILVAGPVLQYIHNREHPLLNEGGPATWYFVEKVGDDDNMFTIEMPRPHHRGDLSNFIIKYGPDGTKLEYLDSGTHVNFLRKLNMDFLKFATFDLGIMTFVWIHSLQAGEELARIHECLQGKAYLVSFGLAWLTSFLIETFRKPILDQMHSTFKLAALGNPIPLLSAVSSYSLCSLWAQLLEPGKGKWITVSIAWMCPCGILRIYFFFFPFGSDWRKDLQNKRDEKVKNARDNFKTWTSPLPVDAEVIGANGTSHPTLVKIDINGKSVTLQDSHDRIVGNVTEIEPRPAGVFELGLSMRRGNLNFEELVDKSMHLYQYYLLSVEGKREQYLIHLPNSSIARWFSVDICGVKGIAKDISREPLDIWTSLPQDIKRFILKYRIRFWSHKAIIAEAVRIGIITFFWYICEIFADGMTNVSVEFKYLVQYLFPVIMGVLFDWAFADFFKKLH